MENVLESSQSQPIRRINGVEVLDPAGLADRLGKSKVTIHRWTKAGKLPHLSIGRRSIFYVWEDVRKALLTNID